MDDRVRKLHGRIRALHRSSAGERRRYPADLGAEIVTVTRAGQAAGRSVCSLARHASVGTHTDQMALPAAPTAVATGD
jgi:hypothetical protein